MEATSKGETDNRQSLQLSNVKLQGLDVPGTQTPRICTISSATCLITEATFFKNQQRINLVIPISAKSNSL